jgi:hypothetical protein
VEVLTRPATEPKVKRSPMAARDPAAAPEQVDVCAVSGREWSGYIVWGLLAVLIASFELIAFFDGDATPWPTLSETAGNLQARHNWTAMPILAGLAVLGARIVFYPWPFRKPES